MRRSEWVRLAGGGVARLILCSLAALASAAIILSASSQAAVLAPTPYMGWNTYYGFGGHFDEATVKSVASSLISSGLAAAGYRIVWLDAGWATGARDSTGQLTVDPTKWPDGMSGMATWLHQQGLEAGIYTDAGRSGCDGVGVGSYGHYQQDADTFAAWGFDAVKVDFCGAGQEAAAGQLDATPQQLYPQLASALSNNSSHRPMLLNVDNFWLPGAIDGTNPSLANSSWGNYQWSPPIAQSWRTDTDIGFPNNIVFSNVLRNLDQDATHPEAAAPGHWNDPDYLGPGLGMTATEAQSQFSMWAILAAPLILGSDPRTLPPATINMLENANVIAVDQDSLGAQGTLAEQTGQAQVWAKPLADGGSAAAFVNRGTSGAPASTVAGAVGLPSASGYTVQDLWAGGSTTADSQGRITALVPAHGVALYRVSGASGSAPGPPSTATLTAATIGVNNGRVTDNTGALSCPGTCSAHYPTGTTVTLTATPLGDAAFAGWRGGGCSGTGQCTVTLGADTKITAAFVSPVHTLSASVSGSGTVTDAYGAMSCPGTCSAQYSDGLPIPLTATPSAGWAFAGWSGGGCSGTGPCIVALDGGDTAVSATFLPARTLTVNVIGAGAGTVTGPGISCPGTCTATYPAGTSVTLAATPAGGSRFGAWFGGGCPAAAPGCTQTLSADTTATVAFDLPRSGAAYVVNTGDGTVTPIDLATDASEPAITGFDRPRYIATAPDGGTAYVVNIGNGTVTPVDLATNRTEPAITGFLEPGPIAVTADGNTAYVLESNRRLVPVDLVTDQAEPVITFAKRSRVNPDAASIAITPDGKTAYLGTFTPGKAGAGGTVAAVDLATGRVWAVIRGFIDPAAIAIAPDGKTAYVADAARGAVTPINLTTNRPIRAPALTAPGAFPGVHGLAVTPDGRIVYVAESAGGVKGGVAAIATGTKTPTLGGLGGITGPSMVAISSNGRTAYFTSAADDSVVPVDVATKTERPAVTGFSSPAAIAVTNPPPRNDSARFSGSPKIGGRGVSDTVTCRSPTARCTTIESLTTIETIGPQRTVGVSAQSGGSRSRRVVVIIGSRRMTIAPGRTVKVTIMVNAVGRALLTRFGRLPSVLVLAMRRAGHTDTLATRKLTIKASGRA